MAKPGDPRDPIAVRRAAVLFSPRSLLRLAEQAVARDMATTADLGATDAANHSCAQFVQAPS
jgi:hypothetical protein